MLFLLVLFYQGLKQRGNFYFLISIDFFFPEIFNNNKVPEQLLVTKHTIQPYIFKVVLYFYFFLYVSQEKKNNKYVLNKW